ncbi:SPT3 Dosage dependent suppressor of Ty-induced promoter mutations-like protein, partial [Coemansia sp. RSA 25]
GAVLATHISAPIMITDDHKSTKFKTERRTTRTKAEYERPTAAAMAALGDGSAAYASHALGGHSSHLHVVDGAAAGFAGGRQAMSARSSPTLRPYAHHAMLDTYSQFASLAGTPSLGNTPMGSPMMSAAAAAAAVAAAAAQMGGCGGGGFDAPFNLPQQASLQSFSAASMAAPGFAQHYGLPPNSAAGLGPPASYASFASAPGLSSASGFSSAPSSGGASLLFGNASGFAQQQQQQHQQAGGGGGVAGLDQTVIPISQPAAIQITQLLPAQGPVAGGISVLISGRGFHANIAVYFGGVQAGRVQVLSPSNIACVLPPTKAAGPAALRIHDLGSAAAMAAVADGCESQAVFTYVEDTDHTMLELALLATGLRPPPPPPSAPAVAERQQSPHSSPDPAISRSADGSSSAKMLQDAAVLATLRQLRAANDSRNLVEIESGLVNLFATLLGRGMLDVSRLNTRHEATGRTLLHFAALLGMLNL